VCTPSTALLSPARGTIAKTRIERRNSAKSHRALGQASSLLRPVARSAQRAVAAQQRAVDGIIARAQLNPTAPAAVAAVAWQQRELRSRQLALEQCEQAQALIEAALLIPQPLPRAAMFARGDRCVLAPHGHHARARARALPRAPLLTNTNAADRISAVALSPPALCSASAALPCSAPRSRSVVLTPDYAQHGAEARAGPMPQRVEECYVVSCCVLTDLVFVRACDGGDDMALYTYPAAAVRHAPARCVVCSAEQEEEAAEAMLRCGDDGSGGGRHVTCVECLAAAVRSRAAGDAAALPRERAVFRCAAPGCAAPPHAHTAMTKLFVKACAPGDVDAALEALGRVVARAAAMDYRRNLSAELAAVAAAAAAAAAAADDDIV
jgi:hypothetical protein